MEGSILKEREHVNKDQETETVEWVLRTIHRHLTQRAKVFVLKNGCKEYGFQIRKHLALTSLICLAKIH